MAPPSCFVALPVPPCSALLAFHAALPPPLRRIHPGDLHVTLAWFGRIDPTRHAPLLALLAQLPRDPIPATLHRLIALPAREHPSAIALTLSDGNEAVAAQMQRWRPELAATAGTAPEIRPPLPHATVARPRGRRMSEEKRAAILDWLDAHPALDLPVVLGPPVLMRSRPPRPQGPHYEILAPDDPAAILLASSPPGESP